MAAGNVPTTNLTALYANTTSGTPASPTIFDAAIQDIVQTTNDNYAFAAGLLESGQLSDMGIINVKDYGAKGDGVTDDTAAIKAAITAAVANQTYIVTGGNKTYRITSKIAITSNVWLKDINLLANYAPVVQGDGVLELAGSNIRLENISIDGGGNASTGVKMTGVDRSAVGNVRVQNCTWDGLYGTGVTNTLISEVTATNCGGVSFGGMITVDEGSYNVLVELCKVETTVGKGFVTGGDTNGAYDITFNQCLAKNTEGEGFYPRRGAKRILFSKCQVLKESTMPYNVDNFGSGVKCSRGAEYIVFEQCRFETQLGNDNAPPFQNQGCSYVTVRDSYIKGVADASQTVLINWHPDDPATVPPTVATPANHNRFERCTFDPGGGKGIRVIPGTGSGVGQYLDGLVIEGCTFQNHTCAIYVQKVKGVRVRNCIIKASAYQTLTSDDTILIFGGATAEDYSSNAIVEENIFEGVPGYAIRMNLGQDMKVLNNMITGTLAGTCLVLFEGVLRGEISGNIFKTPFNTCIQLNAATQYIGMSKNMFLGGGSNTAIRQDGSNQSIVDNLFDVAVPLNPTTGGTSTTVFMNSTKRVGIGTAAPTTGTWNLGDIVYNSAPAASGKIGWVCVTAGTPGTWKPFGAIDA